MDNEQKRLIRNHIRRQLHKMTDAQLESLKYEIDDGRWGQCDPDTRGLSDVWDVVAEAESCARFDMINKLTEDMVALSDFRREAARHHADEDLFKRETPEWIVTKPSPAKAPRVQ